MTLGAGTCVEEVDNTLDPPVHINEAGAAIDKLLSCSWRPSIIFPYPLT